MHGRAAAVKIVAPPPPKIGTSHRRRCADVSAARRRFYSIMKLLQVVRLYLPSLLQSSKSASCRRVAGALQVEDISGIKLPTPRLQRKAGPIPHQRWESCLSCFSLLGGMKPNAIFCSEVQNIS